MKRSANLWSLTCAGERCDQSKCRKDDNHNIEQAGKSKQDADVVHQRPDQGRPATRKGNLEETVHGPREAAIGVMQGFPRGSALRRIHDEAIAGLTENQGADHHAHQQHHH